MKVNRSSSGDDATIQANAGSHDGSSNEPIVRSASQECSASVSVGVSDNSWPIDNYHSHTDQDNVDSMTASDGHDQIHLPNVEDQVTLGDHDPTFGDSDCKDATSEDKDLRDEDKVQINSYKDSNHDNEDEDEDGSNNPNQEDQMIHGQGEEGPLVGSEEEEPIHEVNDANHEDENPTYEDTDSLLLDCGDHSPDNASDDAEDHSMNVQLHEAAVSDIAADDESVEGEDDLRTPLDMSLTDGGTVDESFMCIKDGGIEAENDVDAADMEQEVEADEVGDASKPAGKKRRKRTSSILKSLESIHVEDSSLVIATSFSMDDDVYPRYQSHRAAALVAKSKLSLKGSGRGSSDEMTAMIGNNADPDFSALPSGKRRKKEEASAPLRLNWVQCDKCSKWRSVAPEVQESVLSDLWFCAMNTWDLAHSSCAVDEEEEKEAIRKYSHPEAADEASSAAAASMRTKSGGRGFVGGRWQGGGRWGKRQTSAGSSGPIDRVDSTAESEGVNLHGSSAAKRKNGSLLTAKTSSSNSAAAQSLLDEWVQCSRCRKWRKVPESIDIDSLPDVWYCSMNTWASAYARCLAKQEVDEANPQPNTAADWQQPSSSSSSSSSSAQPRGKKVVPMHTFSSSIMASSSSIKKKNWVQCERKNCMKWRCVPEYIDFDALGEQKWFCTMNTWDLDSATCDAPEDEDSDQDALGYVVRSPLISSNTKGPGALSYRRIMFGTDNKIRNCFSDKNKNGYGIFSYSEAHKPGSNNESDEYCAPTRRVGYWWSSAYDEMQTKLQQSYQPSTVCKGSSKKPSSISSDGSSQHSMSAVLSDMSDLNIENQLPNTHLLDAARRIIRMDPQSINLAWPKKLPKSWRIISSMALFRRLHLEESIVVSVFTMACTSSSQQLQVSKLFSLIQSCRFPDEAVDACREYVTVEGLKTVIKRLEERNVVQVSYANSGQLTVELLPPMNQLLQRLTAARGTMGIAAATGVHPAWAKQGLPLKLRKFYANSRYKSEYICSNSSTAAEDLFPLKVEDTKRKAGDNDEAPTPSPRQSDVNHARQLSVQKPFRLLHKDKWTSSPPAMHADP